MGNSLTTKPVKEMNLLDPLPYEEVLEINEEEEEDSEIANRNDNQQGQIKLEL